MSGHEFVIPVNDLDAAGRHFVFPVRAAWLRGALEDHEATASDKDGELDVRASKSGRNIIIHGKLSAELRAPCARCLDPVVIPVDQPVTLLMVPSADVAPSHGRSGKDKGAKGHGRGKGDASDDDEGREISSEEADTLTFEGDTVVLDDFVRGELMLETPMIPLCSEDCAGMSAPPDGSAPGSAARDIDPRLMPLLRFSAGSAGAAAKSPASKKSNKE
jgi:uncharacterized protein